MVMDDTISRIFDSQPICQGIENLWGASLTGSGSWEVNYVYIKVDSDEAYI